MYRKLEKYSELNIDVEITYYDMNNHDTLRYIRNTFEQRNFTISWMPTNLHT